MSKALLLTRETRAVSLGSGSAHPRPAVRVGPELGGAGAPWGSPPTITFFLTDRHPLRCQPPLPTRLWPGRPVPSVLPDPVVLTVRASGRRTLPTSLRPSVRGSSSGVSGLDWAPGPPERFILGEGLGFAGRHGDSAPGAGGTKAGTRDTECSLEAQEGTRRGGRCRGALATPSPHPLLGPGRPGSSSQAHRKAGAQSFCPQDGLVAAQTLPPRTLQSPRSRGGDSGRCRSHAGPKRLRKGAWAQVSLGLWATCPPSEQVSSSPAGMSLGSVHLSSSTQHSTRTPWVPASLLEERTKTPSTRHERGQRTAWAAPASGHWHRSMLAAPSPSVGVAWGSGHGRQCPAQSHLSLEPRGPWRHVAEVLL